MWILAVIALVLVSSQSEGTELTDYLKARENLINEEKSEFIGSELKLSEDEVVANEYLMTAKLKDFDEGFKNISNFWPSRNFLEVYRNIEQSKLFKILRQMPKGTNLHTHGASLASLDFIFSNLTYLPNLYACFNDNAVRFEFFNIPSKNCQWELMEKLRKKDSTIDQKIRNHLTLPTQKSTPGYNQYLPWTKFEEMVQVIRGIYSYRPAYEMYYRQALQELYDDNILYAEFRDRTLSLYELDGTVHDEIFTIELMKRVVDEFVASHPGFIGIKIIHTASRKSTHEEFQQDLIGFEKIRQTFPDFVLGFDVSMHEDEGRSDVYFIEELLKISKKTKLYLHVGETDWSGTIADENLYDAILLNTTRLGHGVALSKHPKLLDLVKEKNIPIELNPISNQVLGFTSDLRNHPASLYFAKNMTIVVCNDNASFWSSSGLSYDFYEVFLGIMPRDADLRALKQLVLNSINYSGMTQLEKQKAFEILDKSWLKFIKKLVSASE